MIAFIHASLRYDLDHLRHFFAFAFNPDNWITNGSEQVIAALVIFVFSAFFVKKIWPKWKARLSARLKKGDTFLHEIVGHLLKPHLDAHHDRMVRSIRGELRAKPVLPKAPQRSAPRLPTPAKKSSPKRRSPTRRSSNS